MADRLDMILESKRREEQELIKKLQQVRLVIETLEEGAGLTARPPQSLSPSPGYIIDLSEEHSTPIGQRGGRQKGSVSKTWRAIFQEMVNSGHPNTPEEIRRFAFALGLELTEKSARTRARDHLKAGFFVVKENGYWVTDSAIRKFGLDQSK
jgi:hypothetical protein